MNLRRTRSTPGLVLGLALMALGAAAFTDPTLPGPPGVQAESTWTHYQQIIQSDQRTVAHVRNMRNQTPSHGSPGSPGTHDWMEVALTGLFIVLMTGTGVLTAKRRRQEKGNALSCRIFPL